MTKQDVEAAILKYGDRLIGFGFDNSRAVYIGYTSTLSNNSAILFDTLGTTDVIGFPQRVETVKGVSFYTTWHPIDQIQTIHTRDEDCDINPDPMFLG